MSTAQLKKLIKEIKACRLCIEKPINKPLPHEPRPVFQFSSTARICIAGQAPGTKVHESGKPFTDPSGVRLREWMGIDEEIFYDANKLAILPMGFCFPGQDVKGGDLPPRKECAATWREKVMEQHSQLELILCIGMYAQAWHLGDKRAKTLTETVANWRSHWDSNSNGKAKILPLPHPSWRNTGWLKKNPWFEKDVLPALQKEVARLT